MILTPIAIEKSTHKLVNVKDVSNGLQCNCYCDRCKEDLIAVNREIKQKAHFRHTPNSDCEFNKNYESYIHWLTKEVFKKLCSIYLPQIRSMDLKSNYSAILNQKILAFFDKNGLDDLKKFFNDDRNIFYHRTILLQEPLKIQIDKCFTEKEEKSKFGNIRPDILIICENQKLFVEPFFTHEIDEGKLVKIRALDVSTISINLRDFIVNNEYLFTIDEFTDFLISDMKSKKWEYIRNSKIEKLILNLFSKVWPKHIEEIKIILKHNMIISRKIDENDAKIRSLHIENSELEKQMQVVTFDKLLGKLE